jgi:hypothetical protein
MHHIRLHDMAAERVTPDRRYRYRYCQAYGAICRGLDPPICHFRQLTTIDLIVVTGRRLYQITTQSSSIQRYYPLLEIPHHR